MANGGNAPGDAADALELRSDGTVRLRWDTFDVTLRRPKVKEWQAFWEQVDACDEWRLNSGLVNEDGTRKPRPLLEYADGPYLGLYATIIEQLSGQLIDRGDLPPFMLDGRLYVDLNAHWMTVPLPSSGPAGTATR